MAAADSDLETPGEVMTLYGQEASLGRVVTMAEVAAVTVFLASDLPPV